MEGKTFADPTRVQEVESSLTLGSRLTEMRNL